MDLAASVSTEPALSGSSVFAWSAVSTRTSQNGEYSSAGSAKSTSSSWALKASTKLSSVIRRPRESCSWMPWPL